MAVTPESSFGWLDYDQDAADQMREVFGAFDDKDTIDSLGFGVIRDSLSDQLFPGTSTIQTRARYFFFVPWIMQMLEHERTSPGDFNRRLKELEITLIESLRQLAGPSDGVIGHRARARLKRFPSSVYWNGVHAFEIRLLRLSIPEYRGIAHRLATADVLVDVDDDGQRVSTARRMWDPDLPKAPPGFPTAALPLALTRTESEYLVGKIVTAHPESMLGELARDLDVDRTPDLPWDVPLHQPSARVRRVLHHARCFSEITHGAQVLYNILLARQAERVLQWDTVDLQETLTSDLEDWCNLVDGRRAELREWSQGEEFWATIEHRAPVNPRARRFVLQWADLALADPSAVQPDTKAAELVVERERQLKRNLARLTQPRALENWNGQPFSRSQMAFRWRSARQILDDLADHEGE
ncbi:MAG: hypothetical protein FJW86_12775 [Actinobacteria bacterium]|nr:hypothetical protein [Actinomycetota bacterium]